MFFTGERDGWGDLDDDQALTTVSPFLTSLQVFASVGGLALLAEHLPLLYPEVSRQSVMQESGLDHMIKNMSLAAEEWSMIEPFPEDFYEVAGRLFILILEKYEDLFNVYNLTTVCKNIKYLD